MRVDGVVGSSDGLFAVALDRNCNAYVTDAEHFQIIKVTPDGATERWALPERPPQSSSPRGVAVDGQGNVYVTDTPRDLVLKYSPQGKLIATWGECATPSEANHYCDTKQPGRYISPEGIAVDGTGHVYVAVAAGLRILKLSLDGKPEAVWELGKLGTLLIPGSLSIDQGGFLYMAEAFNEQIVKLDPNSGAVVGRWGGERGGGPGQFHLPHGVGVDAAGNMYVTDSGNWRVQKLGPDGAFQAQWRLGLDGDPPCQLPDAGFEPGQFFDPHGITVDGQGTIYVADTNNKRLQRYAIVDFELIPPPDEE
jgi:DNA-binding beta-propeller fold protein YncE